MFHVLFVAHKAGRVLVRQLLERYGERQSFVANVLLVVSSNKLGPDDLIRMMMMVNLTY
jgi:hypothetical protein